MKIKSVIFDLYGTLIYLQRDSKPYPRLFGSMPSKEQVHDSLVFDAETPEIFCNKVGIPIPHDIEAIQNDLIQDVASAVAFNDSVEVLQALHSQGIKLAVISNLANPYMAPLYQLELDHFFQSIVFSCQIGFQKPNPNTYKTALEQLNSTAAETIMVGDSWKSDFEGPQKCGIQGFLLDRSNRFSKENSLRSLRDLFSILNV